MVAIRPYLSVKNALEAIELYKKIFDAKVISHMPVEKEQASSMGLPKDADFSKTTMHSELSIGDAEIYMSDNFSGEVLEKTNTSILIEPDSLEQVQEFYKNAEDSGCEIGMKLEKQFWGDWFGSFKDPFGISWQLNYSPPKEE
ncbi:MAG: VOC family protein [Candidatus Kariarchaeaceae archaeon]